MKVLRPFQVNVKFSSKEKTEIERFCADHEITVSEYLRILVRVHLGLGIHLRPFYDDIKKIDFDKKNA